MGYCSVPIKSAHCVVYIQYESEEEISIFKGDSIGHCENKSSYEHVTDSEWLPRRSFWVSISNSTRFLFVGWMMSEIKERKKKVDIRDKLLARILDAAVCIKEREDQLRRKPCGLHTRVAKFKHYCELKFSISTLKLK